MAQPDSDPQPAFGMSYLATPLPLQPRPRPYRSAERGHLGASRSFRPTVSPRARHAGALEAARTFATVYPAAARHQVSYARAIRPTLARIP